MSKKFRPRVLFKLQPGEPGKAMIRRIKPEQLAEEQTRACRCFAFIGKDKPDQVLFKRIARNKISPKISGAFPDPAAVPIILEAYGLEQSQKPLRDFKNAGWFIVDRLTLPEPARNALNLVVFGRKAVVL